MTRSDSLLTISETELVAFCERWQVKELAVFGSVARGEAGPSSDVGLMVEFKEDARLSLWDFVGMKLELEDRLERSVDLVEKGTIRNPYRKRSIERDLTVVYAA